MSHFTVKSKSPQGRTYRYFVQLVSKQLNWDETPHHAQVVDVVVTQPNKETIESLLGACGWLDKYVYVSHWQPMNCTEF